MQISPESEQSLGARQQKALCAVYFWIRRERKVFWKWKPINSFIVDVKFHGFYSDAFCVVIDLFSLEGLEESKGKQF